MPGNPIETLEAEVNNNEDRQSDSSSTQPGKGYTFITPPI